jgi:3-hydroxyacyl-CoA dehydrogenase/enoyl-CoA hydratase/3-hydroxybutyryl-CoA epimerase
VVIASNKPNSFIAGADILAMFPNTEQSAATGGSQALQAVVNRIEQLPVPTIAAINGPALGAGLELALACDHRLASSDSRVVLGLPEVKLGLLPGSGGTVRLPELIGLREALQVMLQGGNVRTDRAVRIGLLDAVIETGDRVEGEHRFWAGVRAFATQQMGKGKRRAGGRQRARGGVKERLMDGTWAGQWLVAAMAARGLDKETRGRYPAPYFALDSAVQSAAGLSRKQALELEAQYFGKLAVTPESKALMSLFFLMEEAKKRREKTGNAPIIKVKQRERS